jgi:hypothetical protein
MNNQEENHRLETIEQYCNGDLSPIERTEFETLCKSDTALANEVDEYKRIIELIKITSIEKNIKSTLAKLEQEELNKRPQIWIKVLFPYLSGVAAACVMFILYASLSLVQLPGSENDLTIVRDVDVTVLSPVEKKIFESFYDGQIYLTDGQFQKAVQNFQDVLKNTNIRPYFKEATQWHLILAYLKNNQAKDAKQLYDQMNNCEDCVYPVGKLNKVKLWWQIFWANLL